MTEHQTASDEICELVTLYPAGVLRPDEVAEVQEDVKSCGICGEEARAFPDAAHCLLFASHSVAAPPKLREKPLASIQQPEVPNLVPAVVAKRLYEESSTGNVALLVRREPGAKYPPHSHAGASTTHRSSHTVNGCTVSIVASQQNAMLPWTR